MIFNKLTPLEPVDSLPMDAFIAVGFGVATVTKNGEVVYDENEIPKEKWDNANGYEDVWWTCQDAENAALQNPDNDWRINLLAPLSSSRFQRQGEGLWVLYEEGSGFA